MEFLIRPYQSSDRVAVFKIAADTAFFGQPVEAFLEDRHLFCDVFCTYYTDYEPQNVWVAETTKGVVGYLFGCENSASQRPVWVKEILPMVKKNVLLGKYRIGALTWQYLLALSTASLRGEIPHADSKLFPAHLHINILATFRGGGIGGSLMKTFLTKLKDRGVPGVHLKTTSENRAACSMYEKLGFQIVDSKKTGLWKKWLGYTIENRCYGLVFGII